MESQPPRPSKRLKTHLWPSIRRAFLGSWVTFVCISTGIYLSALAVFKINDLQATLTGISGVVREAVEIKDWNFVLSALEAHAATAKIQNLSLESRNEKVQLAGPIGQGRFGIWSFCDRHQEKEISLKGCSYLLSTADCAGILAIVLIVSLVTYLSYSSMKRKTIHLISEISKFLTSQSDTPSYIEEIDVIREQLSRFVREREESSKAKLTFELATQVAHDIRSPLSALRMAMHNLDQLPPERMEVIKKSLRRVENVADQLLKENRNQLSSAKCTPELIDICNIVEEVIREKQADLATVKERNLYLSSSSKNAIRAHCSAIELSNVISNLLNNSIESTCPQGRIEVQINSAANDFVDVAVVDNGSGFPAEVIRRVGERGLSIGKPSGNGLGLSNAVNAVNSWGGNLTINNRDPSGAVVRIRLRASPTGISK